MSIKDFYNSYIPNNHWLTKSMEIGKINNCGTYWYIKKMLVFYYYIFIKKKLGIKEIDEIIQNFNNYIASVDPRAKTDAENFFYEIDIRNKTSIITLNEMLSTSGFVEEAELLAGRKFYFSYIMNLLAQNDKKKTILDCVIKEKNYFKGLEKAKTTLATQGITDKEFSGLSNDVHSFLRNHRQVLLLYGVLNSSPINEEYCSPTTMGLLMFNANFNELILLMEIQKLKQVSRNPLVYFSEGFNRPRDRKLNPNADYKDILSNFNIRIHPYLFYLKYLCENKKITSEEYRYLIARTTDNDSDKDSIKKFGCTIEEIKKNIIKKDQIYIIPGSNNTKEPIPPEDFNKEAKKYYMGLTNFKKDYDRSLFLFASLVNQTTVTVTDEDKANKIKDMYIDLTMYLDHNYEVLYKLVINEQKKKYECQSKWEKFNKTDVHHLEILEQWIDYYNSADNELLRRLLVDLIQTLGLTYEEMMINFPNILKNCFRITKKNNLLNVLKGITGEIVTEPGVVPGKVTIDMLKEESEKYKEIFNNFALARTRNGRLADLYKISVKQNNKGKLICESCGQELSDGVGAVHHIIPINEDSALGPDHYLNLVYVCDNCHSTYHNSKNKNEIKKFLDGINKNNLLKKTLEERVKELDEDSVLYQSCIDYAKRKGIIK